MLDSRMNQFNGGFCHNNNIINRNDLFCWMIDCHSQEAKYHQVAVETLASMLHQLGLAQQFSSQSVGDKLF